MGERWGMAEAGKESRAEREADSSHAFGMTVGGEARSGMAQRRRRDATGTVHLPDKSRGRRQVGPTKSCCEKLPEKGEEAGAGAEAVVRIAGEVAAEHFFFVEEAQHDQRDDEEEAR